MRVLQVIDHLGLGGAQSMVVGLARLTAEAGVETAVLSFDANPEKTS